MYETPDVYSNGMYVSLTCSNCPMVAITPERDKEVCPLIMSDSWQKMHVDYHPGHKVARFVHYVA